MTTTFNMDLTQRILTLIYNCGQENTTILMCMQKLSEYHTKYSPFTLVPLASKYHYEVCLLIMATLPCKPRQKLL